MTWKRYSWLFLFDSNQSLCSTVVFSVCALGTARTSFTSEMQGFSDCLGVPKGKSESRRLLVHRPYLGCGAWYHTEYLHFFSGDRYHTGVAMDVLGIYVAHLFVAFEEKLYSREFRVPRRSASPLMLTRGCCPVCFISASQICEGADKQLAIAEKLDDITDQWDRASFEFTSWKSRGVPVLKVRVLL